MTISTVIDNSTEFYSQHYLESTFQSDLKEIKERWKGHGASSPARRLSACAVEYFRAKEEAIQIEEPSKRYAQNGRFESLPMWHGTLLTALGYDVAPKLVDVAGGQSCVPVLGELRRSGKRWLVIVEAPFCLPESSLPDGSPLEEALELAPQAPASLQDKDSEKLFTDTWGKALGKLFMEEDAPRWAILLAGSVIYLFDREKYPGGRYLSFDLEELLGRKDNDALLATAALLSKDTLAPEAEQGEVLHEALEDNSHKFAYGVSDALQFAVRESIELVANEWVHSRRVKNRSYTSAEVGGVTREITAEDLRHESLIFVYRLLFCFFAEARAELDILPMNDEAYRLGYSLEALRDLEHVPLNEEARAGFYFHEHLKRLFALIFKGFHPEGAGEKQGAMFEHAALKTFEVKPLTATLFDPQATPLLSAADLRNECLQRVIRNLSLSTHAKTRTVGRVNYAELGINQLGAVYEGLLSYKGMFAKEDLIQVKNADEDIKDKKTASWFVPKTRSDDFKHDEIVRTDNGLIREYKKGTFILYLSGIDREKSASYYTPQVLTETLVREALRELLKDYTPDDADRILQLKLCEPAMGSGAFLNEATGQLADKYLELKQKQLGIQIDVSRYNEEKLRVKHYIACRNVYGVDLNPTAVELGGLSLWLGSVHQVRFEREDGDREFQSDFRLSATPWFGLRLRAGNSVIGARRAVFKRDHLRLGRHVGKDSVVPRTLKPGEKRAEDEIYHFLVLDDEMVPAAGEKEVKQFLKDESKLVADWLKREVRPKYGEQHLLELLELSRLVDTHFETYTTERLRALKATEVPASVWPERPTTQKSPRLEDQETIKNTLEASSGSFQRIKLLMDAWCSLWFYPVHEAVTLPTRDAWLAMAQVLLGSRRSVSQGRAFLSMQLRIDVELLFQAGQVELPDTQSLGALLPWLRIVLEIGARERFFHWELHLPEILSEYAETFGFDLLLGNPPWIKATWNGAVVLADFDPTLGVRKAKSGKYNSARARLLDTLGNRSQYLSELMGAIGSAAFLNSGRLYPDLQGSQTNLYKNFIIIGFRLIAKVGIGALLHPEGVYDETNGAKLRSAYYPRLLAHYQFKNELSLFADVHHLVTFGINLFGPPREKISFVNIVNLFHPCSIEGCLTDSVKGATPGIKTDDNRWETRGHPKRAVRVEARELKIFARLFQGREEEWQSAPIPQIHSVEVADVLNRFVSAKTLDATGRQLFVTDIFHESGSQEEGEIVRQDSPSFQPTCIGDVILTGPLFFVGNPAYKTPRSVCNDNTAFDEIDLTEISEGYLPRTVYRPGDRAGSRIKYNNTLRSLGADSSIGQPIVDLPRMVYRRMVAISGERSLVSTVVPPGVTGINAVSFLAVSNPSDLFSFQGAANSIPFDFLVKVKGRTNIYSEDIVNLPFLEGELAGFVRNRNLRLTCLTSHYRKLWQDAQANDIAKDRFSIQRAVLESDLEHGWGTLDAGQWDWKSALRTDFSRRLAMIEIDVLVSLGLGLTINQLLSMYGVQFPVLREYESNDEYDQKGRRLPNTARKSPGAKELRDARKSHDGVSPISITWDLDKGKQQVTKTFYPPFFKVDREEDYLIAYEHFTQRLGL